jgi:hypothetical protein
MEQAFCQRIKAGPPEQDGVCVLNGPAIKRFLEREFGVVYSLWGVYYLLKLTDFIVVMSRKRSIWP